MPYIRVIRVVIDGLQPDAITPTVLLIVTADPGGGGVDPSDHDAPHPDNDRIPLILAGGGVRRGTGLLPRASLLDIPPTILHALGSPVPGCYEGRVLAEALGEPVGTRLDLSQTGMTA